MNCGGNTAAAVFNITTTNNNNKNTTSTDQNQNGNNLNQNRITPSSLFLNSTNRTAITTNANTSHNIGFASKHSQPVKDASSQNLLTVNYNQEHHNQQKRHRPRLRDTLLSLKELDIFKRGAFSMDAQAGIIKNQYFQIHFLTVF